MRRTSDSKKTDGVFPLPGEHAVWLSKIKYGEAQAPHIPGWR